MKKRLFAAALALALLLCSCQGESGKSPNASGSAPADGDGLVLTEQADLDRDGQAETIEVRRTDYEGGSYILTLAVKKGEEAVFSEEAYTGHIGWNSLFLCRRDGEDFLLRYTPYGNQGLYSYNYQLFYLDAAGREVDVETGEVDFDLNAAPLMHEKFDAEEIEAFAVKINALLADSVELMNTDQDLIASFQEAGRLEDTFSRLDWNGDLWDSGRSRLENLRAIQQYIDSEVKFNPKRDVQEEDGVLKFQAGFYPVTVERDGEGAVITVWDANCPDQVLQTFSVEAPNGEISPYYINVADVNFDRRYDFGWKYFQGTANAWYHYWIWHEDEGRFVEEPAFPQSSGGDGSDGICGPVFDEENRAVIGWRRENATDGEYTVYQWADGALTLRRRIQLSQDWDTWVWTLRVFEVEDGVETELYHYEGTDNNGSDGSFAYDEAGRWTDLSYHGET